MAGNLNWATILSELMPIYHTDTTTIIIRLESTLTVIVYDVTIILNKPETEMSSLLGEISERIAREPSSSHDPLLWTVRQQRHVRSV